MSKDNDNGDENEKKDYEVGYRKTPKASRFKPGQSGNPKGRPKASNNFTTDVKTLLAAPVKVKRDGKLQIVSSQKAVLLRFADKALAKGDIRALDKLLDLARTFNDDVSLEAESDPLSETDLDICEGIIVRRHMEVEDDEDELDGKEELLP